jgi:hypothetical protein
MAPSEKHHDDENATAAKEILSTWRRQRDLAQLKLARQGDDAQGSLIFQIEECDKQVAIWEAEVRRRSSDAVADQWTLAEAKYRELIANTWNTDRGIPTAGGLEHIERTRIELGIKRDTAQGHQQDVRIRLAKDVFRDIKHWHIFYLRETLESMAMESWDKYLPDDENASSLIQLRLLGKAIRLDKDTALVLFLQAFKGPMRVNRDQLHRMLLMANNVWFDEEDKRVFRRFIDDLPEESPLP